MVIIILLLFLFKYVGSARLRDRDYTPNQSKNSSPILPTYIVREKRKGEIVDNKKVYLLTLILGVVSKQIRLLHGRVGETTTLVNSLSTQMSELSEDAVAS